MSKRCESGIVSSILKIEILHTYAVFGRSHHGDIHGIFRFVVSSITFVVCEVCGEKHSFAEQAINSRPVSNQRLKGTTCEVAVLRFITPLSKLKRLLSRNDTEI